MAILNPSYSKRRIDLAGPDGNAFALLGLAQSLCRQLKKNGQPIIEEMMEGDYEHLIQVFDREFGDYVDLIRAERVETENDDD